MSRTSIQTDRELNWLKGTTFTAAPTHIWLAAMNTLGTLTTGGTEVTGGSYARVDITVAAAWSAIATGPDGTDRYMTNAADLVFATPSADWGYVPAWEIFDAATVGNRLYFGELDPAQYVPLGVPLKILAGQLRIGAA